MCQSCSFWTQSGRPKYVWDHLWIWLVRVTKIASENTKHSTPQEACKVSWSKVRYLQTMQNNPGKVSRQLSPFVSMMSCLVMAVGSTWCSLKGRIKALPKTGMSTEPHVSAAQWTNPEQKSATRTPATKKQNINQIRNPSESFSPSKSDTA